jgi:predicted restriction endonuclease
VIVHPTDDAGLLVNAAKQAELYKLFGVSEGWLNERIDGAADMFLKKEDVGFEATEESAQERKAIEKGKEPLQPSPGSPAQRRQKQIEQLIRRGDNKRFIQTLYGGQCQISGVVLRLAGGGFTVDCAHIRPLGTPHNGPDDVNNMLSLSPNVHRLLDRGCIRVDPQTLSIQLLHGNDLPHLPKLLLKQSHSLAREHLSYYNTHLTI